jgi:hypothetical protein
MAGDLHHTAQPPTLAAFRPWGSSAGAGRVRPAAAKVRKNPKSEAIWITNYGLRITEYCKNHTF